MNQIACEMCGSSELLKQDGVYVCQMCGCKYSVEEAKKLMISGNIDVSGSTVTVDNSPFVENSLRNARRSLDMEDWEEVERYYNIVEQNQPENIEAIFFSAYGKVMQFFTDPDRFKREAAFKVFKNSISIIDDNYDPEKGNELEPLINKMSVYIHKLINSPYVYNTQTINGRIVSSEAPYMYMEFVSVDLKFVETIENIIMKDDRMYLHYILFITELRLLKNIQTAVYTMKTKYLINLFTLVKSRALMQMNYLKDNDPQSYQKINKNRFCRSNMYLLHLKKPKLKINKLKVTVIVLAGLIFYFIIFLTICLKVH